MIVEPISAIGMHSATPTFFKQLRKLAKDEGIPFIVDETWAGFGQSGKMWAHDYWYLNDRDGGCPDIVTFGGKAGISGFYSSYDYRSSPDNMEQNVDMSKVLSFGVMWRHMQNHRLFDYVLDTSSFLKIELGNAARDCGHISNVRGIGTAIAFDCKDADATSSMQNWLLKRGIVVARVDENSLGLRPAMILGPAHAANLREAVRSYHPNHQYY